MRGFLDKRPNDRVGLVLPAARPWHQAPLTLDHGWLSSNLDRAQIGMIEDGTAIGLALATAVGRLESLEAKSKIVILLDGQKQRRSRCSPPRRVPRRSAIAPAPSAPVPAGRRRSRRSIPSGARCTSTSRSISTRTRWQKIAETTGGKYFRATDTDSLRRIYDDIDKLETTSQEGLQYRLRRATSGWCSPRSACSPARRCSPRHGCGCCHDCWSHRESAVGDRRSASTG
ncbi:MAG: VWA domain-containing protein [Candidatus Binatia bacterium]